MVPEQINILSIIFYGFHCSQDSNILECKLGALRLFDSKGLPTIWCGSDPDIWLDEYDVTDANSWDLAVFLSINFFKSNLSNVDDSFSYDNLKDYFNPYSSNSNSNNMMATLPNIKANITTNENNTDNNMSYDNNDNEFESFEVDESAYESFGFSIAGIRQFTKSFLVPSNTSSNNNANNSSRNNSLRNSGDKEWLRRRSQEYLYRQNSSDFRTSMNSTASGITNNNVLEHMIVEVKIAMLIFHWEIPFMESLQAIILTNLNKFSLSTLHADHRFPCTDELIINSSYAHSGSNVDIANYKNRRSSLHQMLSYDSFTIPSNHSNSQLDKDKSVHNNTSNNNINDNNTSQIPSQRNSNSNNTNNKNSNTTANNNKSTSSTLKSSQQKPTANIWKTKGQNRISIDIHCQGMTFTIPCFGNNIDTTNKSKLLQFGIYKITAQSGDYLESWLNSTIILAHTNITHNNSIAMNSNSTDNLNHIAYTTTNINKDMFHKQLIELKSKYPELDPKSVPVWFTHATNQQKKRDKILQRYKFSNMNSHSNDTNTFLNDEDDNINDGESIDSDIMGQNLMDNKQNIPKKIIPFCWNEMDYNLKHTARSVYECGILPLVFTLPHIEISVIEASNLSPTFNWRDVISHGNITNTTSGNSSSTTNKTQTGIAAAAVPASTTGTNNATTATSTTTATTTTASTTNNATTATSTTTATTSDTLNNTINLNTSEHNISPTGSVHNKRPTAPNVTTPVISPITSLHKNLPTSNTGTNTTNTNAATTRTTTPPLPPLMPTGISTNNNTQKEINTISVTQITQQPWNISGVVALSSIFNMSPNTSLPILATNTNIVDINNNNTSTTTSNNNMSSSYPSNMNQNYNNNINLIPPTTQGSEISIFASSFCIALSTEDVNSLGDVFQEINGFLTTVSQTTQNLYKPDENDVIMSLNDSLHNNTNNTSSNSNHHQQHNNTSSHSHVDNNTSNHSFSQHNGTETLETNYSGLHRVESKNSIQNAYQETIPIPYMKVTFSLDCIHMKLISNQFINITTTIYNILLDFGTAAALKKHSPRTILELQKVYIYRLHLVGYSSELAEEILYHYFSLVAAKPSTYLNDITANFCNAIYCFSSYYPHKFVVNSSIHATLDTPYYDNYNNNNMNNDIDPPVDFHQIELDKFMKLTINPSVCSLHFNHIQLLTEATDQGNMTTFNLEQISIYDLEGFPIVQLTQLPYEYYFNESHDALYDSNLEIHQFQRRYNINAMINNSNNANNNANNNSNNMNNINESYSRKGPYNYNTSTKRDSHMNSTLNSTFNTSFNSTTTDIHNIHQASMTSMTNLNTEVKYQSNTIKHVRTIQSNTYGFSSIINSTQSYANNNNSNNNNNNSNKKALTVVCGNDENDNVTVHIDIHRLDIYYIAPSQLNMITELMKSGLEIQTRWDKRKRLASVIDSISDGVYMNNIPNKNNFNTKNNIDRKNIISNNMSNNNSFLSNNSRTSNLNQPNIYDRQSEWTFGGIGGPPIEQRDSSYSNNNSMHNNSNHNIPPSVKFIDTTLPLKSNHSTNTNANTLKSLVGNIISNHGIAGTNPSTNPVPTVAIVTKPNPFSISIQIDRVTALIGKDKQILTQLCILSTSVAAFSIDEHTSLPTDPSTRSSATNNSNSATNNKNNHTTSITTEEDRVAVGVSIGYINLYDLSQAGEVHQKILWNMSSHESAAVLLDIQYFDSKHLDIHVHGLRARLLLRYIKELINVIDSDLLSPLLATLKQLKNPTSNSNNNMLSNTTDISDYNNEKSAPDGIANEDSKKNPMTNLTNKTKIRNPLRISPENDNWTNSDSPTKTGSDVDNQSFLSYTEDENDDTYNTYSNHSKNTFNKISNKYSNKNKNHIIKPNNNTNNHNNTHDEVISSDSSDSDEEYDDDDVADSQKSVLKSMANAYAKVLAINQFTKGKSYLNTMEPEPTNQQQSQQQQQPKSKRLPSFDDGPTQQKLFIEIKDVIIFVPRNSCSTDLVAVTSDHIIVESFDVQNSWHAPSKDDQLECPNNAVLYYDTKLNKWTYMNPEVKGHLNDNKSPKYFVSSFDQSNNSLRHKAIRQLNMSSDRSSTSNIFRSPPFHTTTNNNKMDKPTTTTNNNNNNVKFEPLINDNNSNTANRPQRRGSFVTKTYFERLAINAYGINIFTTLSGKFTNFESNQAVNFVPGNDIFPNEVTNHQFVYLRRKRKSDHITILRKNIWRKITDEPFNLNVIHDLDMLKPSKESRVLVTDTRDWSILSLSLSLGELGLLESIYFDNVLEKPQFMISQEKEEEKLKVLIELKNKSREDILYGRKQASPRKVKNSETWNNKIQFTTNSKLAAYGTSNYFDTLRTKQSISSVCIVRAEVSIRTFFDCDYFVKPPVGLTILQLPQYPLTEKDKFYFGALNDYSYGIREQIEMRRDMLTKNGTTNATQYLRGGEEWKDYENIALPAFEAYISGIVVDIATGTDVTALGISAGVVEIYDIRNPIQSANPLVVKTGEHRYVRLSKPDRCNIPEHRHHFQHDDDSVLLHTPPTDEAHSNTREHIPLNRHTYSSDAPPQPTGGNGYFQHFYKYIHRHTLTTTYDIPPNYSPAQFYKQHHHGGHPSKFKSYTRQYYVGNIDFGLNLQPVDSCQPLGAPFQISILVSQVSNWTTVNIGLNKADAYLCNLHMIDLLREFFGFYFWFPEVSDSCISCKVIYFKIAYILMSIILTKY